MRSATRTLSLIAILAVSLAGCDKGSGGTTEPKSETTPVTSSNPQTPVEEPPDPEKPERLANKATPEAAMKDNKDVELNWSLGSTPDGSHLTLEYQLTNRLDVDIFVLDQLIAYHTGEVELVPERVIVTANADPHSVRFVRAVVRTNTTRMDHPPGAERLHPGATHRGSAKIPLPLVGWHNYGTPPAIPERPTSAVLEIAYLVGDSIAWGKVTTSDGTDVTIPQLPSYRQFARTVSSNSKPLP